MADVKLQDQRNFEVINIYSQEYNDPSRGVFLLKNLEVAEVGSVGNVIACISSIKMYITQSSAANAYIEYSVGYWDNNPIENNDYSNMKVYTNPKTNTSLFYMPIPSIMVSTTSLEKKVTNDFIKYKLRNSPDNWNNKKVCENTYLSEQLTMHFITRTSLKESSTNPDELGVIACNNFMEVIEYKRLNNAPLTKISDNISATFLVFKSKTDLTLVPKYKDVSNVKREYPNILITKSKSINKACEDYGKEIGYYISE